jgi:diacylglycerol O-acyltransferase / wax synthase
MRSLSSMSNTLSALDASFLELEQLDEGALMAIGGTMVFDPPPGARAPTIDELREILVARLNELPRYTQRLSSARTGSLSWPHWEDDERFDIANHVRRVSLPAPGDEAQLCSWTAELFSHPLDRRRPLWEIALIEGLEGGRWGLGWKTHHCLVDGMGSVDVVNLLLDSEREPSERVTDTSKNGSSALHAPEPIAQAAHRGVNAATSTIHATLHPRQTLARSRALAELIVRDELIAAPPTSLNLAIGQGRRFAVVRSSVSELKAIGSRFDGSLNDAALAACTSGLRRLLASRGEELPDGGLRAMVPVNLRDASREETLGNRVSSLFVELPVGVPDPEQRAYQIVRSTRDLKNSGAADGPAVLIDLAALSPPAAVHLALARTTLTTRLFNLTITNVRGSDRPLYAFGAPMRELYPVVPLAAEHAVGIAIVSYNGLVTFGINADCESVADIEVLALGIEEGLEELRALSEPPIKK